MSNEDRAADTVSIERLLALLGDAWTRRDAVTYAARFTNDGTFTNFLGLFFQGRAAFRDRHDIVFNTVFRGSTLTLRIEKLRFVRPDVAIADTDAEVRGLTAVPSGLTAVGGVVRSKLLMVLVKEEHEWWIAAYHNVAVAPPAKA
jgi:uncharacterized protein (TIGR02246 family)